MADGILMRFDEDINDELFDEVDVDVVVVVLLFSDGCKCLCCERNELPIDEMRSSVARLFVERSNDTMPTRRVLQSFFIAFIQRSYAFVLFG